MFRGGTLHIYTRHSCIATESFEIQAYVLKSCLRNVVSMLHIIEREIQWRKEQGKPEGFDTLRAHKPIIAVGAEEPLEDQKMLADYFRKINFPTLPKFGVYRLQLLAIND